MKIKLMTGAGEESIDEENMEKIGEYIESGTPVMLQQTSRSNSWLCRTEESRKILFISDGTLRKDGYFSINGGRKNFCYAIIGMDNRRYQIVNNGEALLKEKITPPETWEIQEDPNSPPSEYNISRRREGTELIVIGDILAEQFPDAMYALEFAGDAVYFRLDPFYSMQDTVILETDGIIYGRQTQREIDSVRRNCVGASMNLIEEALKHLKKHNGKLKAREIGAEYNIDMIREYQTYPVCEGDYLILDGKGVEIALLKTGKGEIPDETYILPCSDEMDDIIDLAFSGEMIERHYPHGCARFEGIPVV